MKPTKANQTRIWGKATALLLLTAGPLALFAAWEARAEGIPEEPTLYYAGVLEESGELVDGPRDIRLVLWDDAFNGEPERRRCRVVPDGETQVQRGRFRIALNDDGNCTDAVRNHSELWVEVIVEGESLGRSRLGAVPYAVEAESAENGVPPGTIVAYGGETPPPGWLLCDGRDLASTEYPQLFTAIRTSWGTGDGDSEETTDFSLPDLRGIFLRGAHGSDVDPDGDRDVGSTQDDAFASHTHSGTTDTERGTSSITYNHPRWTLGDGTAYYATNTDGQSHVHDFVTDPSGGAETRPVNAAVNYIIKY